MSSKFVQHSFEAKEVPMVRKKAETDRSRSVKKKTMPSLQHRLQRHKIKCDFGRVFLRNFVQICDSVHVRITIPVEFLVKRQTQVRLGKKSRFEAVELGNSKRYFLF